jgi:hypothetical protein
MAKRRALHKRDLFELGWKALITELGVANATRFVMEVGGGEGDYTKQRKKLFARKSLDKLFAEIRGMEEERKGHSRG